MSATASDLVADLAALRPRPDLGATLWRHPALILRLYQPAVAFALRSCEGRRRVLDVGAGYGTVALELARAGHEVTALDASPEACAIARRTLDGAEATVIEGAFGAEDLRDGSFDAIRFGRSLHHMADVDAAAERAALLLAPGGVVVIDEFCAERIDRATASWLASIATSLTKAGVIGAGTGLDRRRRGAPDVDREARAARAAHRRADVARARAAVPAPGAAAGARTCGRSRRSTSRTRNGRRSSRISSRPPRPR